MNGPAAGWLVTTVATWVLAGPWPAAAAAGLTAWHLWRPPRPVLLLALSVAAFALVPFTWVVGNADRLGAATPQVVLANPAPGVLAAVALLLLAVGVVRDVADVDGGPLLRDGADRMDEEAG